MLLWAFGGVAVVVGPPPPTPGVSGPVKLIGPDDYRRIDEWIARFDNDEIVLILTLI
jgi:hypothetical protein